MILVGLTLLGSSVYLAAHIFREEWRWRDAFYAGLLLYASLIVAAVGLMLCIP